MRFRKKKEDQDYHINDNSKLASQSEKNEPLPHRPLDEAKVLPKNRIYGIEKESPELDKMRGMAAFFKRKAVQLPLAVILMITIGLIVDIFLHGYGHSYYRKIISSLRLPLVLEQESDRNSLERDGSNKSQAEDDQNQHKVLQEAITYFDRGWFTAAQTALEKVLNSASSKELKAQALLYLARIAQAEKKYKRAIDFLNRSLSFHQSDQAHYHLAKAYQAQSMIGQAIEQAKLAIGVNGQAAENYLLLGSLYLDNRAAKDAEKVFASGLEEIANHPYLLFNLALAQYQLGDVPSSVNNFELASRYAGKSIVSFKANVNLGKIYQQKEDFERAIEYFQAAAKLAPRDSEIKFLLGQSYFGNNEKEKALEAFELALTMDGSNPHIYEMIGDVYQDLALFEKGIQAYKRALELNPAAQIPVQHKLAQLYYQSGDLYNANNAYKQIIALSPGSHDAKLAHIGLGKILHDTQDYEQAIIMFQNAANLDPSDDLTYYLMAMSYNKSQNIDKAIIALRKAIQLNPDNVDSRMSLASILFDKGFWQESLAEYGDLLQVKPDYAPAHFSVANIYAYRGQNKEALSGYKKVLKIAETGQVDQIVKYKTHLNIAQTYSHHPNIEKLSDEEEKSIAQVFQLAISHCQKAIQMAPDRVAGYLTLADSYFLRNELGDLESARQRYLQAAAMPQATMRQLSEAHNGVGKCFYKEGNYEKALRHFAQAVEHWPQNEEAILNRKTAAIQYEKNLTP